MSMLPFIAVLAVVGGTAVRAALRLIRMDAVRDGVPCDTCRPAIPGAHMDWCPESGGSIALSNAVLTFLAANPKAWERMPTERLERDVESALRGKSVRRTRPVYSREQLESMTNAQRDKYARLQADHEFLSAAIVELEGHLDRLKDTYDKRRHEVKMERGREKQDYEKWYRSARVGVTYYEPPLPSVEFKITARGGLDGEGGAAVTMESAYTDKLQRRIYLEGAYDMCRLLLTSPRFNRPQREIIEEQGIIMKRELESLGVVFTSMGRAMGRQHGG